MGTCIVLPSGPLKETWDLIVMLLILYSAASVPVRVSFEADAVGAMWTFEAGMSLVFITDLLLAFMTALDDGDGKWIVDRCTIARTYLFGWFWIDMPSSIPVELLEYYHPFGQGKSGQMLSLLRFLRMFRLIRLLRLLKVEAQISRLEELLDVSLRFLRLLSLLMKLLFTAHILGCAWFYISVHGTRDDETSWVAEYSGGFMLDETTSVSRKYLTSLYWAFTTLTTVGYGDITPVNDAERVFATFSMVVGSLLFAYIVGDVGALFGTLDRQSALVEEKMDSVKEYLLWRRLPKDLALRTKRYYEHYYTKRAVFDEETILGGLNPQLHQEVVHAILYETLGKLPLYDKLTPRFRFRLFPLLKPLSFRMGEAIYERGAEASTLCFLIKGTVSFSRHNLQTTRLTTDKETFLAPDGRELVTLDSMGVFGLTTLFGKRRQYRASAYTACELLIIDKTDLTQILTDDDISARVLAQLVDVQLREDRLSRLALELRLGSMVKGFPERDALFIQLRWGYFRDKIARSHDPTFQAIKHHLKNPEMKHLTKSNAAKMSKFAKGMTKAVTSASKYGMGKGNNKGTKALSA